MLELVEKVRLTAGSVIGTGSVAGGGMTFASSALCNRKLTFFPTMGLSAVIFSAIISLLLISLL